MYIKSIVLDGFKSYGQRTEISGFDDQFNAITGLNGTGKSNILDSICFVLGITNISHVRATSLQELIFKAGQAGINKATVSITFDNTNPAQCPTGFEQYKEITVTRQVVMGGQNKYLINGTNVQNKKVQDLFCSISLNVNNPHFLIMQGKITKVLNMKPIEILAMVEEAAGTRMYEVKRQNALKIMERKDSKLQELRAILTEEVGPKLKKLKEDREQFLEFQQVERELERMMGLYQCWLYFQSQVEVATADQNLENEEQKVTLLKNNIQENIETAKRLELEIENMCKTSESDDSVKLKELENELKIHEKAEAKANASLKAIEDNMKSEEKKKSQLEKNYNDDTKALQSKEQELSKVQSLFETLKQNDARDTEAFALSQKKFEAISAGMEVNEEGEAQTLQEQLMKAKEEASRANTESKQASMRLNFCQSQLKEKQKELGSNSVDYEKDKVVLQQKEKEVGVLEASISKLNFSEDRMNELLERRRVLYKDIRNIRERVENFEARRPYTKFHYSDPGPNFNKKSIKGVVCQLIQSKDNQSCLALETAAGGRLYNVVVDTEVTSKKLLQHGNLRQRTTFIPLNKIRSNTMDPKIIKYAQQLVGEDNCKPALSLINYDKENQNAMEFIFGNVFICKDMNVAKQITFNERIKKKCVTLDGDTTDPSGTLSGGAPQKGGSILLQLDEIKQYEEQLAAKEKELQMIEAEIHKMTDAQESYVTMKQKLDMARHQFNLVTQRLQQTTQHQQQQEVEQLKSEIAQLQETVKACKNTEAKCNTKAKELEIKMKDSKGYREKQLKQAENEMKTLKQKADKSKKEWKQREQDYETLNLEIAELKKGLEQIQQQIKIAEENIIKFKQDYEEKSTATLEIKETVKNLQAAFKKTKAAIAEKNRDMQKKNNEKEKILGKNADIELKIKELSHKIKELESISKNAKARERELSKKMKTDNPNMKKAETMSHTEGLDLEKRIKTFKERKEKLGRVVNTKAQTMFEHEEKKYSELVDKEKKVLTDKKKILVTIEEVDKQKEHALKLAHEQVSKDFGSIFGTLLPGANAKLVHPPGKNILQGLEIKVSLGGVWKESLTELSGGQRSLAALSLILAMLLFKPAPLYILDEVDAALDLSHTQNVGHMLKTHFKKSQFIIVSLKDGMFNNANVLFRTKFVDGVSMVTRSVNRGGK